MIKIDYGSSARRSQLEKDYQKLILAKLSSNKVKINSHLANAIKSKPRLTISELLIAPFSDLISYDKKLLPYYEGLPTDNDRISFSKLFDYTGLQPDISHFFMNRDELNMRTCYFCNIDFINSFTDLSEFVDVLDFLLTGESHELKRIKGVGEKKSNEIIEFRRKVSGLTGINKFTVLTATQRKNARVAFRELRNTKKNANHFTLDHVIPKAKHPYFGLSLYNFVPCCSACNSKFKNVKEFTVQRKLENIIPSSDNYSFADDFEFKVLYKTGSNSPKSVDDFQLQFQLNVKSQKHRDAIRRYLSIFKINGRYVYHKNRILELINAREKYSDSEIMNIADEMKVSQLEVYKMVFGKELFEPERNSEPFVKFLRDVAKGLKIPNVL